jgi:hypothetical protein
MPRLMARLLRQMGAVIADVPLFLTAPLYRRWHRTWGATPAEVVAAMPGDEVLPHAQYRCTRAITVHAAPADVWPWLVQVGGSRAGFYSDDLLDNLGRPSAEVIVPALQHLEVGQWVPMSPWGNPTNATAFRVEGWEVNRWLLWRKPDSTWAWTLTEVGDSCTRLVTRVHALYEWKKPGSALLGVLLMEFGDFAMMRRMLLGIKRRAEVLTGTASTPAGRRGGRHWSAPGTSSPAPDAARRPAGTAAGPRSAPNTGHGRGQRLT